MTSSVPFHSASLDLLASYRAPTGSSNVFNIGGYDPKTESGSRDTALPPLFVVDVYHADGKFRHRSETYLTLAAADHYARFAIGLSDG